MLKLKQKMRRKTYSAEIKAIFTILFFFITGIFFHLLPLTRSIVVNLTSLFLFATSATVLYFVFTINPNPFLKSWFVTFFIFTFLLEALGVKTGQVFGSYSYGNTLQPQVLGVPLIIGINWVILMMATYSIATYFFKNTLLVLLISPLLIVAFDWVLEPVAIELDYWSWTSVEVPLRNYIAWFMISLTGTIFLRAKKVNLDIKIPRVFFIAQFAFFFFLLLAILFFDMEYHH
jgi:putative membrane protein